MTRVVLFPGCRVKNRHPELEKAIIEVLKALEVEVATSGEFSCCPTYSVYSFDEFVWRALALRNLSIAEEIGDVIVTPCRECYDVLNKASSSRNSEILSKIGRSFKGKLKVFSFNEFVFEFEGVLKKAKKLDFSVCVHSYCGCGDWGEVEKLVEVTGLKVVPSPYLSCGKGLDKVDAEASSEFAEKILSFSEKEDLPLLTLYTDCYDHLKTFSEVLEKDVEILHTAHVFAKMLGVES